LGASLLVALAVIPLGIWGRGVAREQNWQAIQEAVAHQRWAELEARLRSWLNADPEDGNAWTLLGDLLSDRGRADEARAALRRVRESDAAWSEAQRLLGEIAVKRQEAAEAERAFRAAAARDRRAVSPRRRLVYLLSLELRPSETRDVLWQLYGITRDPQYIVDAVHTLWMDATEVGKSDRDLEAFLDRTPDDPWLRRAWGLSLLVRGRPADALPHLKAAAEALGNDPLGRFALAECRMTLGQFDGDLTILGPRPDRPVDAARWWVLRSRLEDAQGQAGAAVESLRAAVAANPDDREAHYRLGQALVRCGDPIGAKVHLDRAEGLRLRLNTLKNQNEHILDEGTSTDALEALGQLCRDAGLPGEARVWFEQALRRDPHRPRARWGLEQLATTRETPSRSLFLSHPVRLAALPARPGHPSPPAPPRPGAGPRFEDVARRAGIIYRYDCGATGNLFVGDTMGGGVALLDFDDDGWLDIYFINSCTLPFDPQSPPAPNKLLRNRGDGTFEDVTARAGVGGRGYGMGCAVGDYDNDGHDDLYLTGLGSTVLYRNRGDGTFEDVTERAGVFSPRWTTAAGFGDLDGDGDLDLVAVTYVDADPKHVPSCRDDTGHPIHCSPARYSAQPDHLFRNNGDGTFTDVSRAAGIDVADTGEGLGLAIADLDGDGRLDVFIANDGSPNQFYRNLGGLRFEEVGVSAGLAFDGSGRATASMGVVAEDLDGDGRVDLLHTNFINEGCTLHRNLGGGLFADATLAAHLDAATRPMTGFGAVALDADNDGRLDLFLANGHVDDQPWANIPMTQAAQLFLGQPGGRFALADPGVSPYFSRPVAGRGAAAGDLDNDGRVDLVVVHRDVPAAVLRNVSPAGHWIGVRLRGGARSGRTPIGARVTCRAGGRAMVRWLTSGTSYLSANDSRLWFGLGPVAAVERLEVRWPSETVQAWSDLPADRILDIEEGRDPRPMGIRRQDQRRGDGSDIPR
jgi:tetratricopeptide (TPR) repeat protein